VPAGGEPFDVDEVDLLAVSQRLDAPAALSLLDRPQECRALAERVHAEALALEQRPETPGSEARQRLFRLHALAAELIESATAQPPLGFYGNVDGLPVSLHDLRAAQLARSEPALLDDPDPAVALRREMVRFYLEEMKTRPDFADREKVIALLSTPLEPPASPP
jgi:hypothetical protein